ncbi:hypothetical protein JR316_0004822 [Psilocybe cubensis]|uniref:Uncharacterized protein n=2 Tax=Psilocybe cubensis TaxID=181762 RepID=A0ACB8H4V1_PSICU|nr:hypothetical protein JR316_0004822 [Psilocybe cubensis]KAH9482722.1 hypothetical protein JR316_0004822 [Psilocybe cubensis]
MSYDLSELPPLPRARSWSFYIVLLAAVVPLWSAIPLAWLYTLYSIYDSKWLAYGPSRHLLLLTIFSLYHYHLARRVSGPSPYGPGDPDEIQVAYTRLLKAGLANLPEDGGDIETLLIKRPGSPAETITQLERHDPRAIDFRHCLRTWFCKVPWSSIKLLDIQKWLFWAMYNSDLPSRDSISATQRIAIDEAVALLQKRAGSKFEEGFNSTITPMRLTIDKINILWRPLTFYVIVTFVNSVIRALYTRSWGFTHGHSNGLEYLLRTPENWDQKSSPRPVVFIHGLGLGLLQYHDFFAQLVELFPDRPILIPIQPQISQSFFHSDFLLPPSRHQMADRLANLLQNLDWVDLDDNIEEKYQGYNERASSPLRIPKAKRGVTLISHSNGSYAHAWVLKGHPDIVARSCFVDPVTFCSWEGDVCYNFFYRPCMTGMELLMRYFVGTEIGVVNLLQRHFCWTSNSLWFEEIPNPTDLHKTLFLLGGKDDIVHSERVKKYLTSHGAGDNLWYDPEGRHGQALMRGSAGLKELFRWLSEDENEQPDDESDTN